MSSSIDRGRGLEMETEAEYIVGGMAFDVIIKLGHYT